MTLPDALADTLKAVEQRLKDRFGARLRMVRLFGSQVRGEATEDSDFDLAIVIEQLTRDEWRDAIGLVFDVEFERRTDYSFSCFVVSGQRFDDLLRSERRIAHDILTEGIPA